MASPANATAQYDKVDGMVVLKNGDAVFSQSRVSRYTFMPPLVNPLSIFDGVTTVANDGKEQRINAQAIHLVHFMDFRDQGRTFLDVGETSLQELMYDGKTKWHRYYRQHGYDGGLMIFDYFILGNGQKVPVGFFDRFDKKFKSIIASRPDLVAELSGKRYVKDTDYQNIPRKYENQKRVSGREAVSS